MTTTSADTVRPYDLAIPQDDLDDLRRRLQAVRWPDDITVDDSSQGPPVAQLRSLVDYWLDGYDWRRCEADLNALGQFHTVIDDQDIYFLHVRSPHEQALPLLVCHGWPGSILEFRAMISELTNPTLHGRSPDEAFHLIIPAMPGFAFSAKPTSPGWGIERVAKAWVELMQRLGYDNWGMHGGDWGSAVVGAISQLPSTGCLGMHVNFPMVFPTQTEAEHADSDEHAMMADATRYQRELAGYAAEMSTRPQTVGYSLADSPVGLAAWIYTLFLDVSDNDGDPTRVITMDAMLDDIMLYWLPNAASSSARLYWEAAREQLPIATPDNPSLLPAGFSIFRREAVRASQRWIAARYPNTVHYRQWNSGGHFAALEQPEHLASDIRDTFAAIRRGQ